MSAVRQAGAGKTRTSTPQDGQNEPIASLKMSGRFSLDVTGQEA